MIPEINWTERQRWFEFRLAHYEIIKFIGDRELIFLRPEMKDDEESLPKLVFRNLRGGNDKYFFETIRKYRFFNRRMNMYYSLVHFNEHPIFSYAKPENDKQRKWWKKILRKEYDTGEQKYMKHLDFAIDIDSDEEEEGTSYLEAWDTCSKIKILFDKFKLPYAMKFSGNSGFHLTIDGKYFTNANVREQDLLYCDIRKALKYKFLNLEFGSGLLDLDGTAGYRRVFKMPYNYDVLSEMIALPFDDAGFNNFDPKVLTSSYVKKNIRLFNRGMLERYPELIFDEKVKNINNFLKEVLSW